MKKLIQNRFTGNRRFILLILLVSVLAALPYLRGDFFHFSDEPHIANLYQMVRSIESGQIPPRWAPDVSYEYGHPLFNFYYVLPYYIGYIFYQFTGSLIFSLKLVYLLTIPLSGAFMFLWLKKHTDSWAALAGSVIYIFTPYRAVDLYVRGALGESVAFVFFPLVALSIYKIFESNKLVNVALLGIASGLFILSHNLASLLFFPWVFIYALLLAANEKSYKKLIHVCLGVILGVGISSFWLIPAFFEKSLLATSTPFNYQDHFPFIKQLIYSPFKYGASNPGPGDDLSFQLGIINWLLIIGSLFLARNLLKKDKIFLLFILGSIGVSIFLMNIRSSFIWEAFSLSSYIQFPWRLLMMTTFLTSSLVIFLGAIKKRRKQIMILLAVASVIITLPYFKPSEYFKPDDNYFLKRFFARSADKRIGLNVSSEYKNYSEDYLLLPKWVNNRPDSLPVGKFISQTLNINKVTENSSVSYTAQVSGSGVLEFNSYYFPGWYAKLDKKEVLTRPLEAGNIGVDVPDGISEVSVFWKETHLRLAADAISALSLVATLTIFGISDKRKYLS